MAQPAGRPKNYRERGAGALPNVGPVCSNRSMRKWQRDRMRRRKAKPATPQQPGQQPEPLQPAYPDMDRQLQASDREPEPAPEPPQEPAPESIAAEAGASRQPSRGGQRRRTRGGRGRRRSAAPAKPAVPPAESVEPETQAPESQEPVAAEVAPELPSASARLERRPQPARRPPKGVLVLAIGLPGSGKTSWFKRRGVTPLSSDLLRTLLFDDATEQRFQDLVFGTLRSLLRARLVARMPWNYVDATNLSPRERHGWIKMAREFGYDVHAVFFDVPLDVCMERNRRRARVVPEDVMQRMAAKLRPPAFEEGFSKIILVRVKKKETGGEEQAAEEPGE